MITQLFAAIVLAVCVAMLLRMAAGPRRTQRIDAALLRVYERCRALLRRKPRPQPSAQDAARAADEAIRRARRKAHTERDGNVYRPKSFRRKREGDPPTDQA